MPKNTKSTEEITAELTTAVTEVRKMLDDARCVAAYTAQLADDLADARRLCEWWRAKAATLASAILADCSEDYCKSVPAVRSVVEAYERRGVTVDTDGIRANPLPWGKR